MPNRLTNALWALSHFFLTYTEKKKKKQLHVVD